MLGCILGCPFFSDKVGRVEGLEFLLLFEGALAFRALTAALVAEHVPASASHLVAAVPAIHPAIARRALLITLQGIRQQLVIRMTFPPDLFAAGSPRVVVAIAMETVALRTVRAHEGVFASLFGESIAAILSRTNYKVGLLPNLCQSFVLVFVEEVLRQQELQL